MSQYTVMIREMAAEERPRERLLRLGAGQLHPAELLAIILRTGTKDASAMALAGKLLAQFGGLRGLSAASVEELAQVKGIGLVKGIQVAACVEIGRRIAQAGPAPRRAINSPDEAVSEVEPELRDQKREHFVAILLDTKNRVIRRSTVSVGSLDSSIVHPREVFRDAIAASAANLIVAHNHPSGDPAPSAEDRQVTTRLVEAGRLLGIEVLDHLIIGDHTWVSLKREGLM